MRHSDMDAALQAVYDRIPKIPGCDRSCWVSCGPAPMTTRERQRIRELGIRITPSDQAVMQEDEYWCEALDREEHLCMAYPVRPLVCRFWGAIDQLKCFRGCIPEGGWLTQEEAGRLVREVDEIGGREGGTVREDASQYSPRVIKMLIEMLTISGERGEKRRIEKAIIPAAFRKEEKEEKEEKRPRVQAAIISDARKGENRRRGHRKTIAELRADMARLQRERNALRDEAP